MSGETVKRAIDPLRIVGKTWDRSTVTVKQFLGAGGVGVFYSARPHPVMIARNTVLTGLVPPGIFGISDIPSTGKPITNPTHIERIESAAILYHADYENMKKVVQSVTALRRLETENLRKYHIDFRGTDVGLKILVRRAEDDDEAWTDKKARFAREIQVLRNLNHPNIVRCIHDGIEENLDLPYVLMELVENALPLTRPDRGPLHPKAAVKIGIGMFRALDHAHSRPDGAVLHRDLKPGNIMVDGNTLFLAPNGVENDTGGFNIAENPDVRLADWGLAWIADPNAKSLTKTGQLFGTPAYMSPWQARSSKHPEPAWDVWSGAATIFNLLTGQAPYTGETSGEVYYKVCSSLPPRVREVNPGVHPQLAEVIERAFRKNVAHVPTAREFLQELEEIESSEFYRASESIGGPAGSNESESIRNLSKQIREREKPRSISPQERREISRLYGALMASLPKDPAKRIPPLKASIRFHAISKDAAKIRLLQKDLAYYRSGADQEEPRTESAGPGKFTRVLRTALVAAGIAAVVGIPGWLWVEARLERKEADLALLEAGNLVNSGQHHKARELLATLQDERYASEKRSLGDRCFKRARDLLAESATDPNPDALVSSAVDFFETGMLLNPDGKYDDLEGTIGKYRQQKQLLTDFIIPGQEAAREQYTKMKQALEKDEFSEVSRLETLDKDIYRLIDMLSVNIDARSTGGRSVKEGRLSKLRTLHDQAKTLRKETSLRRVHLAKKLIATHEALLGKGFSAEFTNRSTRVRKAIDHVKKLVQPVEEDLLEEVGLSDVATAPLVEKLAAAQQAVLAGELREMNGVINGIDVSGVQVKEVVKSLRKRILVAIANVNAVTPAPGAIKLLDFKELEGRLAKMEASATRYADLRAMLTDPEKRSQGREGLLQFHIDDPERIEVILKGIPVPERTRRMKAFAVYLVAWKEAAALPIPDPEKEKRAGELKAALLDPSSP